MPLNEKDLKSIKSVVKDIVGTSIEQNNGKLIKQVKNIVDTSIEQNNKKIMVDVKDIVVTSIEKSEANVKDFVVTSIEKSEANVKDIVVTSIEKSEINIKDFVEYSIDNSEMRMTKKIDNIANDLSEFRKEMHREISDIDEMNKEFLGTASNHETRIGKLELKTGLATK